MMGNLHERVCTFTINISFDSFLYTEMFKTNVVEKIKTHICVQ